MNAYDFSLDPRVKLSNVQRIIFFIEINIKNKTNFNNNIKKQLYFSFIS